MKKILYFDVETTGLVPQEHGIIQLSGAIELNGKIEEEFDFRCKPMPGDKIDQEALDVHGITREEIETYEDPRKAYVNFRLMLGRFCDKFNRSDKFYPAGYNCRFDVDHLSAWFQKLGDKYLGSWINWRMLDPLPFIYALDYAGELSLPNYKLETVCEHLGIPLKAHDAASDIRATRELIRRYVLKLEPEAIAA